MVQTNRSSESAKSTGRHPGAPSWGLRRYQARPYWTGPSILAPRARAARRGQTRPVGVAKELAGEEDEVGLLGAHDVVRLLGAHDHPDRPGGDAGAPADLRRERRLIAGADGDLRAGDVPSARNVDEGDAVLLDRLDERARLLEIPPALCPVRRRDAKEEHDGFGNGVAPFPYWR